MFLEVVSYRFEPEKHNVPVNAAVAKANTVMHDMEIDILSSMVELCKDGHYASVAEKAIKEMGTRLREKFAELKPGVTVPAKIGLYWTNRNGMTAFRHG